jgi:alpha/beta superfamily hydrolase
VAFRLPRGAKLLRFPSGDGLQLEGRLTAGARDRGVVLCTHGEGRTEVADVAGALAHLRESLDAAPRLVAVAGYSFGSLVGGRAAAADPGVGFYLGVAPVLARYDYGFLAGLRGRVALIAPTRDEFSDPARLETLAASLPERPWVRAIDTDHFFSDALAELAAACGEAITRAMA